MFFPRFIVPCMSAALAIGAPAYAQSAASLEIMEELAQGGCVLSQDREPEFIAAIEARGMRTVEVGEELLGAGLIQLRGDSMMIIGGSCADQVADLPPPPEALVATLVAIRDNGCMVAEAQADSVLGPLGPRAEVMGHLSDLDELNFVRINGELGGAVASDRVCNASDETLVSFATQVPDMLALDRLSRLDFIASIRGARTLMLETVAAQECQTLAGPVLQGLFFLGYDDPLVLVEQPLVEAGLIRLEGQVLLASDAACSASARERRAMVAALP